MKKIFNISILLFISIACHSQEQVSGIYLPKGYMTLFFPDSLPLYINGKLYTGMDTSTYMKGDKKLLAVETFVDGFKTEVRMFYESGKPECLIQFKNGKREGIDKRWYENGQIMHDTFIKDGKNVNPPYISYYEDGTFEKISGGSRKDAFSIEFHKNGKLKILTRTISDSTRCGGKWGLEETTWEDNGQLVSKQIINCGKQTYTEYYNDSTIARKATQVDAIILKVGDYTEWYRNGKLKLEAHFKDDVDDFNIKTGLWKYYNDQGKLIKEEYYENDELIKVKEYGKTKKLKEIEK